MSDAFHIETPENIQIAYKPAGLGTRFLAWVVDSLILLLIMFVLFMLMLFVGAASDSVLRTMFEPVQQLGDELDGGDEQSVELVMFYLLGVWMMIWGLGSFFLLRHLGALPARPDDRQTLVEDSRGQN